jgi:hypothetical protein
VLLEVRNEGEAGPKRLRAFNSELSVDESSMASHLDWRPPAFVTVARDCGVVGWTVNGQARSPFLVDDEWCVMLGEVVRSGTDELVLWGPGWQRKVVMAWQVETRERCRSCPEKAGYVRCPGRGRTGGHAHGPRNCACGGTLWLPCSAAWCVAGFVARTSDQDLLEKVGRFVEVHRVFTGAMKAAESCEDSMRQAHPRVLESGAKYRGLENVLENYRDATDLYWAAKKALAGGLYAEASQKLTAAERRSDRYTDRRVSEWEKKLVERIEGAKARLGAEAVKGLAALRKEGIASIRTSLESGDSGLTLEVRSHGGTDRVSLSCSGDVLGPTGGLSQNFQDKVLLAARRLLRPDSPVDALCDSLELRVGEQSRSLKRETLLTLEACTAADRNAFLRPMISPTLTGKAGYGPGAGLDLCRRLQACLDLAHRHVRQARELSERGL